MNATVKRLNGNSFEVSGDGLVILVSYETPVAYKDVSGKIHQSKTRWSASTNGQIAKFARRNDWSWGEPAPQENLDKLLERLTGDTRLRGRSAAGKEYLTVNTEAVDYAAHTQPGNNNLVVPVYRRR